MLPRRPTGEGVPGGAGVSCERCSGLVVMDPRSGERSCFNCGAIVLNEDELRLARAADAQRLSFERTGTS